MLWILRTGAPREDLPARYGAVGTVSSRFYRWRQAGVFDRADGSCPLAWCSCGVVTTLTGWGRDDQAARVGRLTADHR